MILKQWEYKEVSGLASIDELNNFALDEWELCAVFDNPPTYIFKRERNRNMVV